MFHGWARGNAKQQLQGLFVDPVDNTVVLDSF